MKKGNFHSGWSTSLIFENCEKRKRQIRKKKKEWREVIIINPFMYSKTLALTQIQILIDEWKKYPTLVILQLSIFHWINFPVWKVYFFILFFRLVFSAEGKKILSFYLLRHLYQKRSTVPVRILRLLSSVMKNRRSCRYKNQHHRKDEYMIIHYIFLHVRDMTRIHIL